MPAPDTANLLTGIRVVSLAGNVPGPVAAARLVALGAEVVKVEPPSGDPLAAVSPSWYAELIEGQRVLRLDLKADAGRAELGPLLAQADLLLTATRPAALARLGLDWRALHPMYPSLCHLAIVGYPAPNDDRPGHDLTYQAALGLLSPPATPRTLAADMAAAERVVSTALALLLARAHGGEARHAQVALVSGARPLADPLRHGITAPGALLGGGLPAYSIYRAREGWIAVALLEPHFRERFVRLLGADPDDADALRRLALGRTAADWDAWAAEHDLPIAEVRSAPEP